MPIRAAGPRSAPTWALHVLGITLALSGALFAPDAAAQGVAGSVIIGTNVTRSISARPQNKFPLYVSFEDCVDGDVITFPVTLTNLALPSQMTSLEVWETEGGSNNCTLSTARTGTAATCKLIAQVAAGTQKSVTLEIPASDIANALSGVESCEDSGASTLPRDVHLYFLAIRSSTVGADIPATDAAVFDKTKVDLLGPSAPTGVEAGIGENALVLTYTIPTEQDVVGFNYYCDDGSGVPIADAGVDADAAVSDAGTDSGDAASDAATDAESDASSDASTTTSTSSGGTAETDASFPGAASCPPSKVLIPGQRPDPAFQCGSSTAATGTAEGLTNGVEVTVGVAAFDQVGNLGKLSDLACGTPNPIDDFFKLYRQAGGQAGGGFCSIGVPEGAPVFGAAALGVAAAALVRRRARKKGAPKERG